MSDSPKICADRPLSLIRLLAGLWSHLSRRRHLQFYLLLALTLLGAFAEIVSLGAVIPFLGVIVAPDAVFNYPIVQRVAPYLGAASPKDLLLPLTVSFIVAALAAGGLRLLLLWLSTRLAFASSADLSIDVYRRTLYQQYQVHVQRNSSEVISGLTTKVNGAALVLHYAVTLISSVVLLVGITVTLLAINPEIALAAAAIFGSAYALITVFFRKKLEQNSERMARDSTKVVKALQEGLGAIRDVLLDGTQPLYCELYRRADHPLRIATASNMFIGGSPRFVMEAVGMVLIALLAYGLSSTGAGTSSLPMLGALALGAQRLLPVLQQGYGAWTGLVSLKFSLADTLLLLEQPLPDDAMRPPPDPLPLRQAMCLDGVRFRYSKDATWGLEGVTLRITKGSRTGFVGSTGSGKSTVLDIIMGLLEPTGGQLLVDGAPVGAQLRKAWQRSIAHVPQSIFLADTSLAENIALGVALEAIDMERVRQAAQRARIAEFIESRQGGYDAEVGERGVRLSGGQRQRIGIARALYKQATLLVFDEATSALDSATEREVMDAIESLDRELTIIIVAHRLSTVRHCDMIMEFDGGRLVSQGTYEQLLKNSSSFRKMAEAVA